MAVAITVTTAVAVAGAGAGAAQITRETSPALGEAPGWVQI